MHFTLAIRGESTSTGRRRNHNHHAGSCIRLGIACDKNTPSAENRRCHERDFGDFGLRESATHIDIAEQRFNVPRVFLGVGAGDSDLHHRTIHLPEAQDMPLIRANEREATPNNTRFPAMEKFERLLFNAGPASYKY
jgi:hypothetical protein